MANDKPLLSWNNVVRFLIKKAGDDPDREGLADTPVRVMKAWEEWFGGYKEDPAALFKSFEDGAEHCDELIVVRGVPFWAHCEHHITPFFGHATVAYLPNGRVVGLSKINRLVDMYARRLQVQERLTNQIADAMEEHLKPLGVGVIITARHLCIESRGVKHSNSSTITSALRGALKTDATLRAEFLSLRG